MRPASSLVLVALLSCAGCVLYPSLADRACRDDGDCVEGWRCHAEVCVEEAACGESCPWDVLPDDEGNDDGGDEDGSALEGDGGGRDAGSTTPADASPEDASSSTDAGDEAADAGEELLDAALLDAALLDAALLDDGGADAATPDDAGPLLDAGALDTGPEDTGPAAPCGDDDDADGVLFGALCAVQDNCPDDANARQNDEDGDGVGDVCDNCPATPNPSQEDELEVTPDGVGDHCDPRPTEGGDAIAFFDGFNGTALSDVWQPWSTSTGLSVSGGGLHLGNPGGKNRVELLGLSLTDVAIETVVQLEGYTNLRDTYFGPFLRADVTVDELMMCAWARMPGGDEGRTGIWVIDLSTDVKIKEATSSTTEVPQFNGPFYRMRTRAVAGEWRCDVEDPAIPRVGGVDPITTGRVGLRSDGGQAEFSSIVVYSLGTGG